MVDNPKPIKETFMYATGGWVAAPTVKKIINQMIPRVGLEPELFDKNEFKELNEVGASKAYIEQMYSKESGHVKVAKPGSEVTPGVSTVSVAEKGTRTSPDVSIKKE